MFAAEGRRVRKSFATIGYPAARTTNSPILDDDCQEFKSVRKRAGTNSIKSCFAEIPPTVAC